MSKYNISKTITTVKLPDNLYEDFKIIGVRTKLGLQDVVERAMYLYVTNANFRKSIHEQYTTYYTGSSLVNVIKDYN